MLDFLKKLLGLGTLPVDNAQSSDMGSQITEPAPVGDDSEAVDEKLADVVDETVSDADSGSSDD